MWKYMIYSSNDIENGSSKYSRGQNKHSAIEQTQHPSCIFQKINPASMTRLGWRDPYENQEVLVGHRLPGQPINKQTHQHILMKALTIYSIQIKGKSLLCCGRSDQIHSQIVTSLRCISGKALTSMDKGWWPRWQRAWKPRKIWRLGDEARDT